MSPSFSLLLKKTGLWMAARLFDGLRQRQCYGEHGSGTFVGCLDPSIVIQQNAVDNCEAEPRAVEFGGKKRVEYLR